MKFKKILPISAAVLGALLLINTKSDAASETAKTSNGSVTIYAQQAAPSNPEDNTLGPNDGSHLTSGPTMANVTFSATPITAKNGASSMDPLDPSTYTVDSSRTAQSQTTTSAGTASFSSLEDGYYLFHQVTTVGGIRTIDDFIVTVNTTDANAINVEVYPKLSLTHTNDLQKIALTNAKDNFNGATPDEIAGSHKKAGTAQEINAISSTSGLLEPGDAENTTTAGAGDTVTWNINSIFDASQVTNTNGTASNTAGIFQIVDTLPKATVYNATKAALSAHVADTGGTVVGTLTPATDYDINIDASGSIIEISLTPAGQIKAAGLLGNATGQINLQVPTSVDASFVGTAVNNAVTNVTNAFSVLLSNTTPKSASVNVGGVEIEKVDTSNAALKGATFVLVRAQDEAAAKALIIANAANIQNNGATTGLTDDTTAEFVKDAANTIIAHTTGDDGLAAWTGLNLVDQDTNTTNTTNYFAVELQAPAGHDLPSPSTGANVFPVTADTTVTAGQEKIVNNKPFNLPFTGDTGISAIIILATVAGIGAFVFRHKKHDKDEETSK